ncbi:MAG TPA: hypothetical protein VGD60_04905 [Candidatus Acidoferrales bacterium]
MSIRKIFLAAIVASVVFGVASCGGTATAPAPASSSNSNAAKPDTNAGAAAPADPATPAVPNDVQQAAEKSLGAETDVMLFGDLAKTGAEQVLAVNKAKALPPGVARGGVITRAVILEKNGNSWKEILRCDEHLENPKGFLGGAPLAPVNGWRMQAEQDPAKGLLLYFTPLVAPKGGYAVPVGVRWNAKAKRYQSMDRAFANFLGELPALETPESQLR